MITKHENCKGRCGRVMQFQSNIHVPLRSLLVLKWRRKKFTYFQGSFPDFVSRRIVDKVNHKGIICAFHTQWIKKKGLIVFDRRCVTVYVSIKLNRLIFTIYMHTYSAYCIHIETGCLSPIIHSFPNDSQTEKDCQEIP